MLHEFTRDSETFVNGSLRGTLVKHSPWIPKDGSITESSMESQSNPKGSSMSSHHKGMAGSDFVHFIERYHISFLKDFSKAYSWNPLAP